ncbi:replicative DNA polymerase [Nitzschia inconspicua]|uniref:DNA-directed DNA polymerase n=1 Tax=Nitzschia inconspicua TaxID=303405 RepID=A0A9K3LJB7_9STRA|nr:replicative DNA polymerase [Nitzschia inconspicua]
MDNLEGFLSDNTSKPREEEEEERRSTSSLQHHPRRMCSVLNIVIDHSMEDVSPMEVEEWKRNEQDCFKSNLKVPVLRVFGPVIRNDPPLPRPLQSACLYIHNAFPYMLARPVIAGPDGSLIRATSSTNIDWDNPEEVERIQNDIKIILEDTLQSMDLKFAENKGDDTAQPQKKQSGCSNQPIIRKVTVVEGRGFYTFCPGPAAPFLKVEYYDPKVRWKIKLVLEKGLEVPQRFHPDPRQYDRIPPEDGVTDDHQVEEDVLRFHCYEAHIPFTMQFFKDQNLAGMSYIHLRKGRIRGTLPATFSLVSKHLSVGDHENEQWQETIHRCVFLQSNTPDSWRWPEAQKRVDDVERMPPPLPLQQPSQESASSSSMIAHVQNMEAALGATQLSDDIFKEIFSNLNYAPPARGTSCDVEIDCSVEDILNVESILTGLPSDQVERDKIQWRAVPSLQEIWKEERARMKRLLSPELTQEVLQDELSQRPLSAKASTAVAPPFTLNVKERAARSGARLAMEGMWSLVDVTLGLKEDFLRCLSDILERHRKAVDMVDQQLREERDNAASSSSSSRNNGVKPRRFYPRSPPPGKASDATEDHATPSIEEALDALGSLGESTPWSEQNEFRHGNKVHSSSPSMEETIGLLDSIAAATPGSQDDSNAHSSTVGMQYSPREMERLINHVDSPVEIQREKNFFQPSSQRSAIKSGQDVVPGSVALSRNTLELSHIGESMFESQEYYAEEFIDPETLAPYDEVELGEEHCRVIFGVETDSPGVKRVCGLRLIFCLREGHCHADRRAKPGLYKSVTTGAVVDGIDIGVTDSRGEEGDDNDLRALERFCQQSQICIEDLQVTKMDTSTSRRRKGCFQGLMPTQLESSEEADLEVLPSDDESQGLLSSEKETLSLTFEDISTVVFSSREPYAPSKGGVLKSHEDFSLHSLEKDGALPDWLTHASTYANVSGRERIMIRSYNVNDKYIQPIIVAPTRGLVELWSRKRRMRSHDPRSSEPMKRRKGGGYIFSTSGQLEIDSNTRKLTRKSEMSNHKNHFSQGVEEVTWELSQRIQMTPTQASQEAIGSAEKRLDISLQSISQDASVDPLLGIGAQGGRIHVEGGGGLKAKTKMSQANMQNRQTETMIQDRMNFCFSTPVSAMSVEIHVQCREGTSRLDSKKISMSLDSNKDKIVAIVYCFARDPGGGNKIEVLQRGCICTSLDGKNPEKDTKTNHNIQSQLIRSMPRSNMGCVAPLLLEVVRDERHILRRFKDIVRMKDPDVMLSWDTQAAGLGYIIERGLAIGKSHNASPESNPNNDGRIDMVKLMGRTPVDKKSSLHCSIPTAEEKGKGQTLGNGCAEQTYRGSGLGTEWDDMVGAGAAAASVVGRLVFAGWKIVAEEVKHGNASYLPAVVAAVLDKRIPYHDELTLTRWYASRSERWRVLNHRLTQATATLLLFDALDIIGRAGEAARLSGVEFSQSFPGIRGSQYKVEGVLLRALKSLRSDERGSKKGKRVRGEMLDSQSSTSVSEESKSQTQSPWKIRRRQEERSYTETKKLEDRQYFFFSPSLDDANKQEALEVQALTLEPVSGHYTEPVVVCDFTALYPSLVIAYNLCYSTCAGKLEYHSTRREMQIEGRTRGRVGPITYPESKTATILKHHFKSISDPNRLTPTNAETPDFSRDRAYISPSGTVFLSESVLKGVLPQVLDEILTTRAMLKRAAKEYKKAARNVSPAILRQIEARQLALKYVANVTYGYTSATFSGRCAMPLLADSIVECGRRTLRKAMNIANRWGQGTDPWGRRDEKWLGATVIYGDTDSLFIKMPGRSYKEAFHFGELLCSAVTSLNPPPVQLKLEKVYLGSIMQTMKRYGGMKFESKNQKKPTFEAKGLETVRRDQCALTQKILRNALITLFRHGIHAVKEYLFRQWSMIIAGKLPVSDFILTGRVRSKYRGSREGPVQAVLARRLGEADPGRIVRHKERLPYVIVATPGMTFKLKDCVLTPLELLERWDAYRIHSGYYIERHVNAALQRCLGLAPHFVRIDDWYQACPKPRRRTHFWPIKSKRAMITAYFGNDICSLCNSKCQADGSKLVVVCNECQSDESRSIQVAASLLNKVEQEAKSVANECSQCNGCYESADTFAVVQESVDAQRKSEPSSEFFGLEKKTKSTQSILLPMANCVCIDCPRTFQRHRLRERGIEAKSTYKTLTR